MKEGKLPNVLKALIYIAFLLLPAVFLPAQDHQPRLISAERLIAITDSILGPDDELVNGKIYYQKNLNAEGHPFYLIEGWQDGIIKVNGKVHTGQQLRYDIAEHQLIAVVSQKSGASYSIILTGKYIEWFRLSDQLFINNRILQIDDVGKDEFLHQLHKGKFSFFARYKKTFVNDYNEKTPFGKYSKMSARYYIITNDGIHRINSQKSFVNYFEVYKKDIKKFMKMNKINFNKAGPVEMQSLMSYCDSIYNPS